MKDFFFNKNNFFLRFILISVCIVFLLQYPLLSFLRVPLLIGHVGVLFFFNFKIRKLVFSDFIYFFLVLYVIVQGVLLQKEIDILVFIQALISVLLYYLFSSYNCNVIESGLKVDFHKIAEYITYSLPFFYISFQDWSLTRSAGLLGNPNITAHVFIMLTPFCLFVSHKIRYYILLIGIVFVGLVMFASRSALLAFLFGLVTYFVTISFKRTRFRFPFYLILLGLVIYLSFNAVDIAAQTMANYGYFFSDVDSRLTYLSYNGRDMLHDLALERLKGNELIGLGFDGAKFETDSGHILSTHNGFLEIFLRLGYIGSAIYLGLLIYMIYNISKASNKYFRGAALMGFAIFLSLSTNSSTFFVFNYLFYYIIFMYSFCVHYDKINLKISKIRQ